MHRVIPDVQNTASANDASACLPAPPVFAPQAWISRFDKPLSTGAQGPLAGLRFAAKDNIDALGLPTTAACPAFSYHPAAHAAVVQKLLDAGASLVGKT